MLTPELCSLKEQVVVLSGEVEGTIYLTRICPEAYPQYPSLFLPEPLDYTLPQRGTYRVGLPLLITYNNGGVGGSLQCFPY